MAAHLSGHRVNSTDASPVLVHAVTSHGPAFSNGTQEGAGSGSSSESTSRANVGGDATSVEAAAGPRDLSAVGLLHPDEAGRDQAGVRLIVTTAVLRAGRGPLTHVDLDGLVVMPGVVVWIVTTNKGWAHLRGIASTADGAGRLPFRADLYCADSVGDPGPDRMALRLYAAGVNPNVASPSHKIQGWMHHGSIRIGPRSASDLRPTPGALDRPG